MRGKKYLAAFLSLCLTATLIGCGGSLPDMTEDEYNQTVEYAASLLMKWSNNGQERLVYVDAKELQKQRKKAEQAAGKEETAQVAPEPPKPVEPAPDETPDEKQEVEEPSSEIVEAEPEAVPSEDASEGASAESKPASDPDAVVISADEPREILDDIFLSYQGYMVSSTYPESSKSYVVNADKGKRLLVLRFDLYNASDNDKAVNLIPMNLMFQVLLNGKNIGYSSVTFLPNDLASYTGNIESRAHESVVVLTQIGENEATNIQDLGMIVSKNGKTQNIVLK